MCSEHSQHLVCQEPEGHAKRDIEALLRALYHDSIMLRVREELAPLNMRPLLRVAARGTTNLQAHFLVRRSIIILRLPHPSYPTVSEVFGIIGSRDLEGTLKGYEVQLHWKEQGHPQLHLCSEPHAAT